MPVPLRGTGTVVSVRTSATGELLIRVSRGEVVTLGMAGKQLLTQDGHPLLLASVRPGDAVAVPPANVVLDRAQIRTALKGIVTISAGPYGQVLAVQVAPKRSILVDIGRGTRINGKLPSVVSRMAIMDSDRVVVAGILDRTFDEMTQTWTIDGIGQRAATVVQT